MSYVINYFNKLKKCAIGLYKIATQVLKSQAMIKESSGFDNSWLVRIVPNSVFKKPSGP